MAHHPSIARAVSGENASCIKEVLAVVEDFLRPKSDYSCWYDSAPEQKGGTGLLVLGRRIGLLGVDRLNSEENVDQNLVTLLYVAMTRARYRLTVPYTVENDLIRRVISCLAAEGQKETEVD